MSGSAASPVSGFWPGLAALLWFLTAQPGAAQDEPQPLLGPDSVLAVSFEGASYALGWTDHLRSGSAVAGADEKLLIFRLLLENRGKEDFSFDASALEVRAVDETGVVHDWPSTMYLRSAGPGALAIEAQRIFRTVLLGQRSLHVYSAIPVPARLRVVELLVSYRGGADSLAYDLRDRVTPLPTSVADAAWSVSPVIGAGVGDWLAGTSLDLRIEGSETSGEPAANQEPGEERHWVLFTASMRNRSTKAQDLSPASFRNTRLITDSGAELRVRLLLFPDQPTSWRPSVAPDAQVRFRLAFSAPVESAAGRLRLQVVGNAGRESHRYDVGLRSGPRLAAGGPHATGVFAPGAYAVPAIVAGQALVPDEADAQRIAALEELRESDAVGVAIADPARPATMPAAMPATERTGDTAAAGSAVPQRPLPALLRVASGERLYVGVDNELVVEIPGQEATGLRLEYPGASFQDEGGGRYRVQVARPGTGELRVYRDNRLLGRRQIVTYRIPDPVAKLGREGWDGRIPPAVFKAQGGVLASLDDFPYAAKCDIVGFELSRLPAAGQRVRVPNLGARFNTRAQTLVDAAAAGDVYLFNNVRAKCPGDLASRPVNPMVFVID